MDDYYECSRDAVGEEWSSMYIPGNTMVKMGYSARMAELALIF